MKKTDTWLLRYSQPSHKTHDFRNYPTETTDVNAGTYPTLLKNRETINRRPDKSKGEEPMPVPMTKTVEVDGKRYSCIELEVPKTAYNEKKHFSVEEWAKCEKDRAIVNFAKKHLQTSYIDINGKQLNANFHVEDQPFYILENVNAMQDQQAETEQKVTKLGYELSIIYQKEDKAEFINLCYLMGINPSGVDYGQLYNILSIKIKEDPERYDQIIDDADRALKILINKALRVSIPNKEPQQSYIVESSHGDFVSYHMEGRHIATGMDSLIGYLKDNPKMLQYLEQELGMEKKTLKKEESSSQNQEVKTETIQSDQSTLGIEHVPMPRQRKNAKNQ